MGLSVENIVLELIRGIKMPTAIQGFVAAPKSVAGHLPRARSLRQIAIMVGLMVGTFGGIAVLCAEVVLTSTSPADGRPRVAQDGAGVGPVPELEGQPAAGCDPGGAGLLDELVHWRRTRARELVLPLVEVAPLAVLRQIAAIRPTTRPALGRIAGVGPRFLMAEADQVLAIVRRRA